MDKVRIVRLLAKNAYVLQEDLKLMGDGALKVEAFGVDVTSEQATRLQANLDRIEDIMRSLGCDPA